MSPKAPCDDKPLTGPGTRYRNVHFRNRPHPHRCARSLPPRGPQEPRLAQKAPSQHYENLLLYYLTKLKNLFSNTHPQPGARENSAIKLNKLHNEAEVKVPQRPTSCQHPYRYTSSNPPRPREEDVHAKVYKVVSAALQYGYANNVLEKKGDYFMLKNRPYNSKLRNRAPTPGPRYCGRCCNVHKHLESELRCGGPQRGGSSCDASLHSIRQGKVEKMSSCPRHPGRRHSGLKVNVNHCPQCRALERRL